MNIEKNKVVSFHYDLSTEGQPLESSRKGDPMSYLHGAGNIIPGLEKNMEGRQAGDQFEATVPPEEAYGHRQQNLVTRLSAKRLGVPASKLKRGMMLQVQTQQGPQMVRVLKAGRFMVDLDANHPMAGLTLTFDVEITDVRDATAEELAHGHAHGPGGHQHGEEE
ncbi:MAG: peptidylprolyl isomerase [Xanthomonadales bacterium]|nr:peptidylprolyl isomerase [Xanthomonadales bacterium]